MELAGTIDTHVHASPDVRPRKTTALELVRAARAAGMKAVLLKNHDVATTALAATLQELEPDIRVFGGLVLNESTGGLYPATVEVALRMGAKQIWMPTYSARQEREYRGHSGSGLRVLDENGRIRPEVQEICRLIAEYDAILGTAHLSPEEIVALVRFGRDIGIRQFLITHPEIEFLHLSLPFQKELAGPDVWFERCYVRPGFVLDWDGMAHSIREVGVDSTVLATDLGQPSNPHPVEGLREMVRQLADRGFSSAEMMRMASGNAARLLGLE